MGEYAKRRKNRDIVYSQSWKQEKKVQKTLDEYDKKIKKKKVF